MLLDTGYRVIEVADAEAALDMVKAANPRIDLLLTDVIMPEKSGVEFLKQCRAVYPNLRSLFMLGYTGDLIAQCGLLVPEATFLERPFTRSSLLNKVRSALQIDPSGRRRGNSALAACEKSPL